MDIHPAIADIITAKTVIGQRKDVTVMHPGDSRNAVWNGV